MQVASWFCQCARAAKGPVFAAKRMPLSRTASRPAFADTWRLKKRKTKKKLPSHPVQFCEVIIIMVCEVKLSLYQFNKKFWLFSLP